ncbi:Uncharacterised protein [Klebsiella quasipneumoniae]|nr:Uncharacterised protein [Klebsiella quasipneumoniae]
MYRTHLIDIDASGMALADIVAAEQQLFNANFNAGGEIRGGTPYYQPIGAALNLLHSAGKKIWKHQEFS